MDTEKDARWDTLKAWVEKVIQNFEASFPLDKTDTAMMLQILLVRTRMQAIEKETSNLVKK